MLTIHYPIGHLGTDAGLRRAVNDHCYKKSLARLVARRTVGRQVARMTARPLPVLMPHHGTFVPVTRCGGQYQIRGRKGFFR